jgi:hypothetical protein
VIFDDVGAPGAARYISGSIIVVALSMMVAGVLVTRRPTVSPDFPVTTVQAPPHSMRELLSLNLVSRKPRYSYDDIEASPGGSNVVTPSGPPATYFVDMRPRQDLVVTGWAYDDLSNQPAGGLLMKIDGASLVPVPYGSPRSDVATQFGNAALTATGFSARLPAALFSPGRHRIDFVVVTSDGAGYYLARNSIVVRRAP